MDFHELDETDLIIHDPRPTRADALKNRELLLETAQRLFAEKGVDAVSMSEIAAAAGVGKGTLYRNFADKAALCQELLDTDMRAFQTKVLGRLRANPEPCNNLKWFLEETLSYVLCHLSILTDEVLAGTAFDHPAHLWWRQTIRGLIAQIQPSIDYDYAADILYVMLDPRTLNYQLHRSGFTPERLTQALQNAAERLIAV